MFSFPQIAFLPAPDLSGHLAQVLFQETVWYVDLALLEMCSHEVFGGSDLVLGL